MVKRRVFDNEMHVQFVTFSCYKRRNFLQQDLVKRIAIGHLGSRLAKHDGLCTGFVIMPDHVHALVRFSETGQLSPFMNKWKDQSSHEIRKLYRSKFPKYWEQLDDAGVWLGSQRSEAPRGTTFDA